MKHQVRLKDIAIKLGLSVSTVSRAIKGYPDIGKETKERVLQLVEEMHYEPDAIAASLRQKRSHTIGVIIPEIVHFFFSNVIKGIMNHAESRGYRVLITLSENKLELEKKQAKLLFGTKVDGVLVSLANESENANHFEIFKDHEVPIVMFDKIDEEFECSKVVIDDHLGGYNATNHLIERGCKRIAHIRGPLIPKNAQQRFDGYKDALQKNNINFNSDLVKTCREVTFEEGYAFAKELFSYNTPPDGIFAITDQVGAGVLLAAKEFGISIPDQLKVVGFSDSQIAKISQPPLTTIHQSGYETGETASRLLIDEIELEGEAVFEKILLDTYPIIRKSTE